MLTCSPETAALLAQPEPTECRIEWAITPTMVGNGHWLDISYLPKMQDRVKRECLEFGPGTHWVITR